MVQALAEGHAAIKQIVAIQKELRKRAGKPKWTHSKKELDAGFVTWAEQEMSEPLLEAMQHAGQDRVLRPA